MKTVGFIKQHDSEDFSHDISHYFFEGKVNQHSDLLIKYMQKGVLCVPLMGAVENKYDETDDEFIGYLAVYTDGEYIWPQYALEYLKKYPHFHLSQDFVSHATKREKTTVVVSEKDRKKLERTYYELGDWEGESF